tara:strand:+ start:732 stop:1340 length:609 start_codon:yes stop_codon:yes gene_type:complete
MAHSTADKRILNDGVITFMSKKVEFSELSNFSDHPVKITRKDGSVVEYQNGESAFHGEKLYTIATRVDQQQRSALILVHSMKFVSGGEFNNLTPAQIKQKGGKKAFLLNPRELAVWDREGPDIQRQISRYKAKHSPSVHKSLMKTVGKMLVHPAMRVKSERMNEKVWEGRATVVDEKIVISGQNMLGKIWMEIRDEEERRTT